VDTRRALLVVGLALAACHDDERERKCQLAVRSLVAAPEDRAAGELEKVLAFGRYALPDIEQEYHAARRAGRARLIEALSRIADPEAVPLLALLARWEEDAELARLARAAFDCPAPPSGRCVMRRVSRGVIH
jgi:hypothetical protein